MATSAKTKNDNYMAVFRLITAMSGSITPIQPDDPEEELLRLFEDFESTCGNFSDRLAFVTMFRSKLAHSFRSRHESVMRRPHVNAAYATANAEEALYTADLLVITATGHVPVPHGNYKTTFWPLYRAAMLGQEETEWQHIHRANMGSSEKAQGDRTLAEWYEEEFAAPALLQFQCPTWPTGAAAWSTALAANLMVANVDPFIHAMLFSDPQHQRLVTPDTMTTWDDAAIYQAMRTISNSGVYKSAVNDRTKLSSLVATITATSAAHVAALEALKMTPVHRTAGTSHTDLTNSNWADLTPDQRATIHHKYMEMEAFPAVPGTTGTIELKANGKPYCCYRWSDESGCHRFGHRIRNCPSKGKPPLHGTPSAPAPLPAPPPDTVPVAAPVTQQTITDLFAALQMIAGSGSDVDNLAAKYGAAPL